MTDLLVDRDDLTRTAVEEPPPADLADGEIRVATEAFGLTANNVTYALTGDLIGYWRFFPAAGGWGRVPVWGFARVTESRAAGVDEGRRLFGFLAPSSSLVLRPARVTERGLTDATPHRLDLPGAYQAYTWAADAGPGYAAEILLRPLFLTAFLLADLSVDEGDTVVVVTSASSKTATATARMLVSAEPVEVIGLTSPANRDRVRALDVYDWVLTYDEVGQLPDRVDRLLDFSGSGGVIRSVHERLGEGLAASVGIGATHQEPLGQAGDGLPGPTPAFFFAPTRIAERIEEWGRSEYERRVAEAWGPYAEWAGTWLEPTIAEGLDSAADAWRDALGNRLAPTGGAIVRL